MPMQHYELTEPVFQDMIVEKTQRRMISMKKKRRHKRSILFRKYTDFDEPQEQDEPLPPRTPEEQAEIDRKIKRVYRAVALSLIITAAIVAVIALVLYLNFGL